MADVGAYAVPDEVVAVCLDGEVVAWHEGTACLHRLDPVGSAVLQACDGARDDDAVVTEVAGRYAVDETVVRPDVLDFLTRLEGLGLLRRRTA